MRIAERRHIVSLLNPVSSTAQSTDVYGGITSTYSTAYSHVHAAVFEMNGREFLFGKQVKSEETYRFNIRYLANVDTGTRVVYNGQTFNVTSVIDVDQKRRILDLITTVNA